MFRFFLGWTPKFMKIDRQDELYFYNQRDKMNKIYMIFIMFLKSNNDEYYE